MKTFVDAVTGQECISHEEKPEWIEKDNMFWRFKITDPEATEFKDFVLLTFQNLRIKNYIPDELVKEFRKQLDHCAFAQKWEANSRCYSGYRVLHCEGKLTKFNSALKTRFKIPEMIYRNWLLLYYNMKPTAKEKVWDTCKFDIYISDSVKPEDLAEAVRGRVINALIGRGYLTIDRPDLFEKPIQAERVLGAKINLHQMAKNMKR